VSRAITAVVVWLGSYALFRMAADAGLVSVRTAAIGDGVAFAAADLVGIFWAYRASRAARASPPTRRAWRLWMFAAICISISTTVWSAIAIRSPDAPLPNWINVFYGAAYALTLAGLLSFPSAPRRRTERLTFSFDIATVTLSGLLIFWYWSVSENAFTAATSLTDKALVVAFPVGDLLLLITAALLLLRAPDDRSRRIFRLIALAQLCGAVGDFGNGYLSVSGQPSTGVMIETLWMAGSMCMIVAAITQCRESKGAAAPPASPTWLTEVPFMAVGAAFVTMLLAMQDTWHGVAAGIGTGVLVITGLAIVRQRIAAREESRLMQERAQRDSRFRALIQHSSDVVLLLDASLATVYVSPAIEGVLGYPAESAAGKPFVDWVAAEDRVAALHFLARLTGAPLATDTLRCRMVHHDGTARRMEIVACNRLGDPVVGGIVLNCRDTTERYALEEQLQHTQKLEVVGRLAGGIAHDFNNLLMVIGANAEFVLSEDSDVAACHESAREIKETTRRAAALTKQLLAFSRRQNARPVVLDPNEVVRRVERMLVRLMQHAARLQLDLTANPGVIEMDGGQLEQALLNLAVNARDAMPDGGKLTLRTAKIEAKDSGSFGTKGMPSGDYVLVEVSDTGTGIPPDIIDKIFEPFFTTKEVGKGTGLGLSTVYGIVKQTGGYIYADSEPGRTTFRIFLPRHVPAAHELAAPAESKTAAAPGADLTGQGKILLVEDEEGLRALNARGLASRGYTVLEASNGVEAIEVLEREGRVDLVVSDVVMPEMDGPSLLKELRTRDASVKVIFVSGYAEEAFAKNLPQGEQYAFLAKPFTLKQLVAEVKKTLVGA
jgi:PAS domain S-box-containing protein